MLIFSLRREERITGEAASLRLLQEVLTELRIPCESPPNEVSAMSSPVAMAQRFAQLQQVAAANAANILLVKVPTAAQLPFAMRATRGFRGRLIFWIDGLMWRPLAWHLMLRLLSAEPLLTTARVLLNNRAWTRLVRNDAVELVVASQTQRAELVRCLSAARIHVVPNGSPESRTPSAVSPIAAQNTAPFGYIGHAYLTKGVLDLVAAYRMLKQRGIVLPLVVALSGLGGDRFRVELSRESIDIRDEVDKTNFYPSLRALVAPFWTDWGTQTFPNVLLEALAFGVPVVTADLPVCRELFANDLAVFVQPNDARGLAKALEQIYRGDLALPDPNRLRAHFAAHFSREIICARWREILAGSPSASRAAAHD